MTNFLDVFRYGLEPTNLLFCAIGCILGTAVGVLPGLGAPAAIAMLLTITNSMTPASAIIMLAGIYYGVMYGGSTTSILVNLPGEPASVVTCLDGFAMAKQGKGGQALAISAIGSFLAGTFGVVALMFVAPLVADLGFYFGPAEYVWLMVFGLTGVISFSGDSLLKGLICVVFGSLLASIGIDIVSGLPRLSFGSTRLLGGIELVSLFTGLFGVSEMIGGIEEQRQAVFKGQLGKMLPRGRELYRGLAAAARGTFIGFWPGFIPGLIPTLTAFWAYDVEKRISKTPEKFGQGMIEGVAAPESANNATCQAGFIPLLFFGIPTTGTHAILLAALVMNGLRPGPLLFSQNPEFVWALIGSMYIGNVLLLLLNLPLVGLWARLSLVPYKILAPLVLGLCFIGSYSIRNSMFDVACCMFWGVLGFLMKKQRWPVIALVLGFLLGHPLEQSFRQALQISSGNIGVLLQSSISKGSAFVTLSFLTFGIYAEIKRKSKILVSSVKAV